MKKVKCPQMKCCYNIMGGCRNCKICNCEPNIIDEDCDVCWNCANDEGILRWDNEVDFKREETNQIKPMEIKAK